jgi:DNA-binding NarL/FixJ family response regulator
MKETVNILLADDHPIFREGLTKIIQTEKNYKITYFAGNGIDALQIIRTKTPQVAVLDISMPGLSGIEICKFILTEKLTTIPIILTMYSEEEYLEEALENEVKGYLLKESTTTEIIDCIRIVLQGGFYISKELTSYLINSRKHKSTKNEVLEKIDKLTHTERMILKLLAENKTSTQIAEALYISHRTVQNHRMNICHKIELCGHNKLLLFAIEHKLLL